MCMTRMQMIYDMIYVTHDNLLPFIHNCHPIDVILEKRCIRLVVIQP